MCNCLPVSTSPGLLDSAWVKCIHENFVSVVKESKKEKASDEMHFLVDKLLELLELTSLACVLLTSN